MLLAGVCAERHYGGELDGTRIEMDYFPASLLLYDKFTIKDIEFPAIVPAVKREEKPSVIYSVIPAKFHEDCIKAVAENLVTGDCELPPDCVGLRMQVLDHTWYGSKVVLCYSYHKNKVQVPQSVEYSINHSLKNRLQDWARSNKIDMKESQNMIPISTRSGTGYVPDVFLNSMETVNDLAKTLNATGNFHAVSYNFYPYDLWLQMYLHITSTLHFIPHTVSLPDFDFKFVCTRKGWSDTVPIGYKTYDSQSCGELVPATNNLAYCSNLYIYPKETRCPLDYLPRVTTDTIRRVTYIKKTSGGLVSGIINGIVSGAEKLIEPFAKVLVQALEGLIKSLGKLLGDLFVDLEPLLEKLLEDLVSLLEQLMPLLIKLISALAKGIWRLVLKVNEEYMLFEWLFVFTYLSIYYKNTTSLIISITLFAIIGFVRPEFLKEFYASVFEYLTN